MSELAVEVKIIGGILSAFAALVAFYFAYQKITVKVLARYTVSFQRFSSSYISEVVLTNMRNNTVVIWKIYAVLYRDIQVVLDEPKPPLILKPYETLSISPPKYTSLTIGPDEYKPDFWDNNTEIFIETNTGIIPCKVKFQEKHMLPYRQTQKHTRFFGEHVYNDNVKFILAYYFEGKQYTAFITPNGFIGHEWNFGINKIGMEEVVLDDIKNLLNNHGFGDVFSNFLCYEVNRLNTKLVYRKAPNSQER